MVSLLSVEKAAQVLSLSPWTVRGLLRKGELERVKIGTRVLIEASAVQKFIEKAKKSTQAAPIYSDAEAD